MLWSGLFLALLLIAACAHPAASASLTDEPDKRPDLTAPFIDAPSYEEALRLWRSPEDINAWIGARFRYDMQRAMRFAASERAKGASPAILEPAGLFMGHQGMCVDLARFAVETLRKVSSAANPRYVRIRFEPLVINGKTLESHWLAMFEHDGKLFFFADSKRPGYIAGPYGTTEAFMTEYAAYRGRRIVSFDERDSFTRRMRSGAVKRGSQ